MRPHTASAAAVFLALSLSVSAAGATELVGAPVRIASGSLYTVQAVITPDKDGGFAAFSMRNSDDDVFFDNLYAQFYGANRKPKGAAFRFDGKVKRKKTVGVFLNGGAFLGSGAILVPYIANLTESGRPAYLAQLFEDGRKSGGLKSVQSSVASPYPPVQLRDGRALVTWDPASGGFQQYGFASPDGDVGTKARSFNSNYIFPVAIEGGFLTTFLSGGSEEVTLKARIHDATGKPVREFALLSAASSSSLPRSRIVGLTSGEIAVLVCERDAATERCTITGQRYSLKGKKLGDKITLVENAPQQALIATHLPGGGLLASVTDDSKGAPQVVHRAFDGRLAPTGEAPEDRPSGAVSNELTTLTDGRVAARYTVNGEKTDVYVQIVAP